MSKFKLTQTAAEVQDILNNCNGLKSDAEGNLTASKNLGVDGKLTLKSLVSASNPDGDITKELGGGGGSARHGYTIFVKDVAVDNNNVSSSFHYEIYTTKNYNLKIGTENTVADFLTDDNYKELRAIGSYPAAGYHFNYTTSSGIVWKYKITDTKNLVYIYRNDNRATTYYNLNKPTFTVVQLF